MIMSRGISDLRMICVRRCFKKSFVVYYQPQMDLKTGRITCVEGLARWNRFDGMVMSPDSFIPFSKETGLIFEIDGIVMEKAFYEISGLLNYGVFTLKLSLNCSAKVMHMNKLPDVIAESLSAFNMGPGWFEL